MSVDPLKSLWQRRLMLKCLLLDAHATVVQQPNFSWFGYPDDTTPTSRNFAPGLTQENAAKLPGKAGMTDRALVAEYLAGLADAGADGDEQQQQQQPQ